MLQRLPPAMKRYLPYLLGIFVVALLLYSLAMLRLVPSLEFLLKPVAMVTGKDQTFSNRTAIWQVINDHIALRPLLGNGYGAYWTGKDPTTASYDMVRRLYFYPSEGHNGYLDIINDLGAVGGLCLVGYILIYLRQGLQIFAKLRAEGALYLVLLFNQLIANLTESRWFNVLTIEFVIMTMVTFAMARTLLQLRAAAAQRSGGGRSARLPRAAGAVRARPQN
jgi:exopolysaccharide production protein ExoQ